MDGVTIIPAAAPATLATTFGDIVAANAVAIVAILFFVVVVAFVMRWFRRSSKLKG